MEHNLIGLQTNLMHSTLYKAYALTILTLIFGLNNLDRSLITLLLQPIKVDLHLSDTELGFLTGIAFAFFYAVLGIPIARLADRGNRVSIASVAIGLWGVTVMSCVLVVNFTQLLLCRIASAIGESGCMPPTYSLVGDYFPGATERTRSMAVYMAATPLAYLASFLLGGWLNERFGWRLAFFTMGIPGLLVAIITKLTLVEPRTQHPVSLQNHSDRQAAGSIKDALNVLWRQRSSRHLTIAYILLFTMGLGLAPWYAAFLIRSHHIRTDELGLWLGIIFGVGGTAGNLLGGSLVRRWFTGNEAGQLRLCGVLIASLVPGYLIFLLIPQKAIALTALIPMVVISNFLFGPTFALMQRLVPDEVRATTLAIVMLLINLIGMGIGPQIVGVLSDLLMPTLGDDSLRYAMLAMSFLALYSARHFIIAGQSVSADLVAMDGATAAIYHEQRVARASKIVPLGETGCPQSPILKNGDHYPCEKL